MKPSFDIIPHLTIHPTSLTIYNEIHWTPYKPSRPRTDHLTISDKKTHGKVSVQARRKVGKAIDYLLYMANDKLLPNTAHGKGYNFKIAFITLTLPSNQIHPDNQIKSECLNQFLIELRYRFHVANYIWRAEKQKNGNIHFHLLIDKFIPWSEIRDRWNRITNKLGYVDRYRDQMRSFHSGGFHQRKELLESWSYKSQIKAYKAGKANDWHNPNSTDIHSLYRIKRVKEYITKYCTKEDVTNEVNGRLWSCNEELSDIKGATMIIDSDCQSQLDKIILHHQSDVYRSDYFTVIHVSVQSLIDLNCDSLYYLFSQYMLQKFKFNAQRIFTL